MPHLFRRAAAPSGQESEQASVQAGERRSKSGLQHDTASDSTASPQNSPLSVWKNSTMKPQAAMFKSMEVAEKLHPSKALRAFFPGLARRHLAKLSDLPVDILMTILAMFSPLEVLVIRYTCKAVELASRQRWVWYTLLERYPPLEDNPFLLPARCRDTASASELERFATYSLLRPLIMKAAIGRKPHLRPIWLNPRRRIFIPSITGREQGVLPATEDGHELPDIIALPGGRYCLIHDHRDKQLQLCQLRLDDYQAKLVAVLSMKSLVGYRLGDFRMTEDGSLLRVVIIEDTFVRDGRIYTEYFSVYEVALDSPCPVFRLYARKQSAVAFISNRVDVALGVDCLVCADCTRIHLMSLSGNRQKTWIHNTDERAEGSHLQHVQIVGSHIVLTTIAIIWSGIPNPHVVTVYSNISERAISTGFEELMLTDIFERKNAEIYYPMRHSPGELLTLFVQDRSRGVWSTEAFRNPHVCYQLGPSLTLHQVPATARKGRSSEEQFCINTCKSYFATKSDLAYYKDGIGYEINLSFPSAEMVEWVFNNDLSTSFDAFSCRLMILRRDGTLEVINYL